VSLLEVTDLKAGYGTIEVVRDASFQVSPGEVVVVLGPNGAGKTTMMLTVSGELPQLGGQVRWLGRSDEAPVHARVKRGMGLVTEDRCVLMQLTVAENLRVAGSERKLALELFPELGPHLDRKVGLLSGGQQQILALARALARRPRLLLADELSLGLAPQVVQRLLREVRGSADRGVGVLLVEQHVHQALAVADRVLVMNHGRIVLEGTAEDFRGRIEDIQHAYLAGAGALSVRVM
jgi:branched-chain amino acid transport system ATP-binding protein